MSYRVEITEQAQLDIEAAYQWISAHLSKDYGERWYRGLLREIATLSRSPRRLPLADESDRFPFPLRVLLYGKRRNTYRVIFTVEDETVFVLFVQHSARDELQP